MAKTPNHVKPKNDGWQAKGFVNLNLTREQLTHAFETFDTTEKALGEFLRELDNGYRFTFSKNEKTDAIVCSSTHKDTAHQNSGWILTSHAPTWEEALCLTLYKHQVILEGVWGDADTKVSSSRYG